RLRGCGGGGSFRLDSGFQDVVGGGLGFAPYRSAEANRAKKPHRASEAVDRLPASKTHAQAFLSGKEGASTDCGRLGSIVPALKAGTGLVCVLCEKKISADQQSD